VPSYSFDVIAGITYRIDITQPARHGKHRDARRITSLEYQGQPVTGDQNFIVITNNYRADSAFAENPSTVVLRAPDQVRDVLTRYVLAQSEITISAPQIWSFAPIGAPVTVSFESAPEASKYLLTLPGVSTLGEGGDGYNVYALQLN